MAGQGRHVSNALHANDQKDNEKGNTEAQPPSARASATPVSNDETHTPMDWDTTDRKTRDQTDHHLTSTDVERRENRTSCHDVQPHTFGDVVGTETHTSVQSQETSFRDSENQLVETRTTTQVGEKNTIIHKTFNTGNHVHNHFHYSCPPPPHHHGDSSSSYPVPCHCRDCLHYHHNEQPPLAETHRPQPESEPRHLGLPPPVPQLLPGPQQTQHTESTERSEPSTSGRDIQSSESVETRREFSERIRDSVCILDSAGRALEPGDAIWMGDQYEKRAIYVGNQQVVYCRSRGEMVVKEELAMRSPFGKFTVKSKGRLPVYPPRERVDRATAKIGRRFTEGDERWWRPWSDFPTWVYTGLGYVEDIAMDYSIADWLSEKQTTFV